MSNDIKLRVVGGDVKGVKNDCLHVVVYLNNTSSELNYNFIVQFTSLQNLIVVQGEQ